MYYIYDNAYYNVSKCTTYMTYDTWLTNIIISIMHNDYIYSLVYRINQQEKNTYNSMVN